MQDFKIGDRVKAKLWNGAVIGHVTKVVGRCIFLDSVDTAGVALVVDAKVVTKIPGLGDIGYAVGLH